MDFQKTCRLCALTYDDPEDFYNIFTKHDDFNLIPTVEDFASIKITPDDNLPNIICVACYNQVFDLHNFRIQIQKSVDKLNKALEEKRKNEENAKRLREIEIDEQSSDDSRKSEIINEKPAKSKKITNEEKKPKKRGPDPAPKTIICPVCGKILKRNSYSDHYSNLHQEEANIECDVCGKMFKNKRQLWHHKRKHQDQTCSCDKCGKTFKNREGFRAHFKNIHLGIRNHSCKICSRKFARIMALKQHMRSHTGEKPYTCSYCSRSFAGKWTLKQHVRLHTKDKPYRCQICGDAFTQNVMLKVHIKNKHP